jgi:hypothetical protein
VDAELHLGDELLERGVNSGCDSGVIVQIAHLSVTSSVIWASGVANDGTSPQIQDLSEIGAGSIANRTFRRSRWMEEQYGTPAAGHSST